MSATNGNSSHRVAAIDIGSHTLLLLIAEGRKSGSSTELRAVHDDCRFGRLGKGLDHTGALDASSVEDSLSILRRFRERIDEQDVDALRVVGTQALREASNAAEFIDAARVILDTPLEIITGEREAQLVHRAASESFPELADQTFVVADVGGGSTEIIVARPGLMHARSLPIGSVRLHERHLRSNPPTPDEVRGLIADIDQALAALALPGDLPDGLPTGVCLVGTSGTATTIASVQLKLRIYDPDRVHGLSLPRAVVERQLAQYLQLSINERLRLPGLRPERAATIDAGAAIFARLLSRLDATRFLVSERGVRWGLAHEMLDELTRR